MASPISIGDAILLSQLAYRLGHSLFVGRRQASAELREVQNQLYSLSKALDVIGHAKDANGAHEPSKTQDSQEQHKALVAVIDGCRQTLTELDIFANKFVHTAPSTIAENGKDTSIKKLRNGLLANWKKVKWTMDGQKLEDLRRALHMHVAALSLFLDGQNRCIHQPTLLCSTLD